MRRTMRFDLDGKEVTHLRRVDPPLGELIERVGAYELALHPNRFNALAHAIVDQQLSVAAARTIWSRFTELCDGVDAESVVGLDVPAMRSVGLSNAKAAYMLDLAARELDGSLGLDRLDDLDDEGVIADLTQVKGIGRWTAEMFLIFSLGRLDVFAVDDVGLQRSYRRLYGMPDDADRAALRAMAAHAEAWSPYRSVASLYLWEAGS